MTRITLLQHWQRLEACIEEFKNEQINRFFETNFKPDKLYWCARTGEIEEFTDLKFFARYEIQQPYYLKGPRNTKNPKKADVEALKEYYETIQTELLKPIVWVVYPYKGYFSRVEYDEINGSFAFEPSSLEERAKELKELFAPREGYSPCRHCGKQVPTEALISSKIIGRDRKEVWNNWKGVYESKAYVTEVLLKFCSHQCAANEQMGREG